VTDLDRRTFLRALGFGTVAAAAAATAAYDVERLLWVPDEKTIVVLPPAADGWISFKPGDVFTIAGRYTICPWTRKPTNTLAQFIVRPDGDSFVPLRDR